MLKSVLAVLAVLLGSLFFVQGSLADGGGGGAGTRIRLEARMRAAGVEAKVAYDQEGSGATQRRKVQAEIRRGTPNTTYAVYHKGVQIATITTDALGAGRVERRGADVPVMQAGDSVGVGTLSGSLVAR